MVFRKTDILAIALVVVMAVLVALLFLPGETPGGQVQIYQDRQGRAGGKTPVP